ncbi:unnamed protein product [Phaeothamnion confervicola]
MGKLPTLSFPAVDRWRKARLKGATVYRIWIVLDQSPLLLAHITPFGSARLIFRPARRYPIAGVSHTLLVIFGLTVSLLIGLMTIVMLNATFMLVAIMKYDTNARDPAYPSFQTFWDSRCEGDWRRSFQAFNFGMPLFLAMNSEVSWIIFNDYGMAAPIIVSIVCTVFFVIYALTTYRKWAAYLGSLRRSDAGVDGGDGGHGHNLAGGNGNGAGVSGVNGSGMRPSYHGGMPGAAWGSPSPQAAAGEPAWGPVGTSMPPRGSAPAAGATGGSDGSGGIDPRQESSHWA